MSHTRSIENPVQENSGYPDQSPHFAVSNLGLLCLPMSNKKDVKSIWVGLEILIVAFTAEQW